jgi:hypothetical protein
VVCGNWACAHAILVWNTVYLADGSNQSPHTQLRMARQNLDPECVPASQSQTDSGGSSLLASNRSKGTDDDHPSAFSDRV